jgi:hypothetical protein
VGLRSYSGELAVVTDKWKGYRGTRKESKGRKRRKTNEKKKKKGSQQ